MVADTQADVVILGGGSGGYAAALRAAELGKSVVLIEKAQLGGTCLHRGCIPTKALLHAAEIADATRDGPRIGVLSTLAGIDMSAVGAYKDGVVDRLHQGLVGLVASRGVAVIAGEGRLSGARTIAVGADRYTGRNVVLATGSAPRPAAGAATDGRRILDSEQALALDRAPASAIILGGGVIGLEFASVWRSFGADVTVVEAMPRLAPLEDAGSSALLERAFRRRGIAMRLGRRVSAARATEHGVHATLDDGEALDAEILLVAIGRDPVSEGLGYAEAGIAMDGGFVRVDPFCRTSVAGVYAVGDLIRTPQLAHVGFAEGILAAEHMSGLPVSAIDYAGVPRIAYCDPEVASVGLTEAGAAERFGAAEVVAFTYDLAGNGRSQILRGRGAVKVVARRNGPVVGVHMVGPRVGELIAEAQLICNWEALPGEVAALVHPHPSLSEAIGEAHMALAGKPLHAHG